MKHTIRLVALICVCLLLVTACSSSNSENTETPPTSENTQQDIPVTEEATPDVDIAVTEEPQINSVSENGEYYIAVSYTVDPPENDSIDAPPEGQRWLIVVATLANQTGQSVTVNADDLALLDVQGNRYLPEPADDDTQPPMVGAVLAEGEDVLGLARFALPEDVIPTLLEWCPGGDCETPLQSQIP